MDTIIFTFNPQTRQKRTKLGKNSVVILNNYILSKQSTIYQEYIDERRNPYAPQ